MSLRKTIFRSAAVLLTLAVVACSSSKEPKEPPGPAEACQHLNEICDGIPGYKMQDCSASEAAYAGLSITEKNETDKAIPCVMAAKSCQIAINCISPPSTANGANGARSNEKTTPKNNTEDACEHINSVCKGEDGFSNQDCSHSTADYDKLSPNDKEIADSIVPCVMDSEDCETAFQCLKVQ